MSRLKPRSKKTHLRYLRDLKVSLEVRKILADIAVEVEGAYYDALNALRKDVIAVLFAVHHGLVLDASIREAAKRALKKLKGRA